MDKKASSTLAGLLSISLADMYYKKQHEKWRKQYVEVQQELEPLVDKLRVLYWEFDNASGHRLRYQIVLNGKTSPELKEWDSLSTVTKYNLQEALNCPEYVALVQQKEQLRSQEPFENGLPVTYFLLVGLFMGYMHAKFLAKK